MIIGVIFYSKLQFNEHINQIVNSACKTPGFVIRNTKSFTNINAIKCLYYSLLRSKLEYCSIIWHPYYMNKTKLLEQVQRKFLKFLYFKVNGNYPTRHFSQERLLEIFEFDSLWSPRMLFSITFLYNLLHNKIDNMELLSLLNINVPRNSYL